MAEARDGEQLGDALEQADDDRVEVREVVHARRHATSWPVAARVLWKTPRMRRLVVVRHAKARARLSARRPRPRARRRGVAPRRPRCASGPRATARSATSAAPSSSRTPRGRSRPSSSRSPARRCARGPSSTPPSTTACATSRRPTCSRSLAAADPGEGDLVVVGHNPTVVYLVADLADDPDAADRALDDGFPLCGVAVLSFEGAAPAGAALRARASSGRRPRRTEATWPSVRSTAASPWPPPPHSATAAVPPPRRRSS